MAEQAVAAGKLDDVVFDNFTWVLGIVDIVLILIILSSALSLYTYCILFSKIIALYSNGVSGQNMQIVGEHVLQSFHFCLGDHSLLDLFIGLRQQLDRMGDALNDVLRFANQFWARFRSLSQVGTSSCICCALFISHHLPLSWW